MNQRTATVALEDKEFSADTVAGDLVLLAGDQRVVIEGNSATFEAMPGETYHVVVQRLSASGDVLGQADTLYTEPAVAVPEGAAAAPVSVTVSVPTAVIVG